MPRTSSARARRGLLSILVLCALCLADARWLAAGASPAVAQATARSLAITPRQLLIGFHPGTPAATREAAVARHGGRVLQRLDAGDLYLVEIPADRALGVAAGDFAADGAVRFVEPNHGYQLAAPPDDPQRGDLWGLDTIAAPIAWETTTGSAELVVGVVDTGIDHTHPDLAANIWTMPPALAPQLGCASAVSHGFRSIGGLTGCAPADTADDNGHGTMVAGTIGAVGDNGIGVVGVNWRVKLMSLKALDALGRTSTADAVAVIEYAVAARRAGVNLRVLNLAWSDTNRSEALRLALAEANDAGILVVAAAGDDDTLVAGNDNTVRPIYPASYGAAPDDLPNIIAVTASRANDSRRSYANHGAGSVHLAAPGDAIWSTAPGGRYDVGGGTGLAAAHVSGAAALLLSAPGLGDLGVAELKRRLVYCGDLVVSQHDTITNRRLNVAQALAGCPVPSYTLSVAASPAEGGAVTVSPGAASYPAGTVATLQARAQPGYRFTGWRVDGADRGASNPLRLTVFRDHAVIASFEREGYTLALSATAGGRAQATPAPGPYAPGTEVTLTATADAGFAFAGWTIDGGAAGVANPLTLVMDRNHSARASFAPLPSPGTTFVLDLSVSGGGSVAADAPGPYPSGVRAQLTAAPDQGQLFVGWTIDGAPGGAANPLTLTMNADHAVRANFAPGYVFQLSWTQGGSVRVETPTWPSGSPYPPGTLVTLTATTNSDYVFTGWTIDNVFAGWATPFTLTMDGPHTVVANFARRRHFTDLPPGPPPYEAISQLAARLIILGYSNGAFGPTDTTQRAQMAALVARAMDWDREDHGNPFTDGGGIDPNLWRNVGTLAFYGVARGYGDGRFGTFDRVLKVQVISFITRGMVARGRWVAETADDPALYPNVPASTGHRLDLVTYYRNAGVVPGTVATEPWPDWTAPATRGWFAEALWQALDSYYGVDRVP